MNTRRLQSSQFSQTSIPLRREQKQRLEIVTFDNYSKNSLLNQTDLHFKHTRQRNSSSRFRISSKPSTTIPGIKPLFITLKDQTKQIPQFNSQLLESCFQPAQYSLQKEQKDLQESLFPYINYPIQNRSPKASIIKKKSNKQQKQDNQTKLQINLRIHIPNINENVDVLMGYYNRKMKYQNETNVFVFNSKDDYIKRVLLHWGWMQNKVIDSPFYHLKWTYIDSSTDHKSIQGQILNHFKNNQEMTSKGGLMKNMKNYNGFDMKIEEFIPRSYDLTIPSDADCFYYEYERSTMMAILKKHFRLFKNSLGEEMFQKLIQQVEEKRSKNKKRWRNKKYEHKPAARKCIFQLSKYEDTQNFRQDFVVDINILLQCIRYYRNQMKLEEDEDWNNPQGFLSYNKQQFIRSFPAILKYSRTNPPYANQQSAQNSIKLYSTPSTKLIKKIIKYYLYFQNKNRITWNSDGENNVWVIKPANNSRGNGIFLHNDCYEIINSSQGHNRIVQKYIENPLVCMNPQYPLLFNKKFDIRQWVLVTSYNPLNAWMFSSCYLRICSQNYDISDIKSLQKHLTNYSFNKSNFNKKQQSIESLENFKQYLVSEHSVSWQQQIKPRIKNIISNTLITCSDNIVDSYNRFELYGFDILIDSDFNPWLLEVNLSPACQERAEFLRQYCECMGQQLLRIVLPSSYCQKQSLNQNQRLYRWQKLPEYYEEKKREEIDVSGNKINIKMQKKIERVYNENSAAIVIQSVMKMVGPKKQLRRLKQIFLSKTLEKYMSFILVKTSYSDKITNLVKKDVQQYVQTSIICQQYSQKLLAYNYGLIQKYLKIINPHVQFKQLRLHQTVKNIQSIYQHFKCLKIIESHKYSNSMAKKIQRWYRHRYKSKASAANIIKKYVKLHIYNKKAKQFLYDLQYYKNRVIVEKYMTTCKDVLQLQRRKMKTSQNTIEKSIHQFFQLQRFTKKKLSIFDREVGRVMRVNIRRTRVYHFPFIKEYINQKLKMYLKFQKYLGTLFQMSHFQKKARKLKTKIISRYLKGIMVYQIFLKRKALNDAVQYSLSSSRREQQSCFINSKIYRCPPIEESRDKDSKHKSASKNQIVKVRQKMPLINRQDEEERLSKYISKIRQTRTSNSRNTKKY